MVVQRRQHIARVDKSVESRTGGVLHSLRRQPYPWPYGHFRSPHENASQQDVDRLHRTKSGVAQDGCYWSQMKIRGRSLRAPSGSEQT